MNTIKDILNQRQDTYGSFVDVASATEKVVELLNTNKQFRKHYMNMAIYMIVSKLVRINNGDPTHIDSWVDIAGYAQLVVDELNAKS